MVKRKYTDFDEWKKELFENIKFVESAEEKKIKEFEKIEKMGCSGLFVKIFFKGAVHKAKKKQAEIYRNKKYPQNAEKALADFQIKKEICAKLKGNEKLPVEIAESLVKVIWELPQKKINSLELNSMTVAYMSYKISKTGVGTRMTDRA